MIDKTLVISFSGGRTSGYMTKKLLETKRKWKEVLVLFANTGQEHEKTLEFINNCDQQFGFNTVWLEAVTHKDQKKGSTAKVVSFETASRDGKPFEGVIEKYGIPWSKAGHCTRELKENPIKNYLKERGLDKHNRVMAIGIRADEAHRKAKSADLNNFIYPLIDWDIEKEDILSWWEDQPFDLEIPEHMGNCVWCWKKSYIKLVTVMKEKPEAFEFPERMEKLHGKTGNIAQKMLNNGVLKGQKSMKFFRGFRSVDDIREMAEEGTDVFIDEHYARLSGGCSEECQPNFGIDDGEDSNRIPALNAI
ncbi:MAG: hypothetical protein CL836_08795 [Crocinitomicaceae bacterium]|nr:hypothetical protein [Crocinitomicaceae bacterium]